jgi:hypothetical protein
MQPSDTQALLEQLVGTVEFLCRQTADLVDDRSTRVHNPDDAPGVRLKADEIRVVGRNLLQMLNLAQGRTNDQH